MPPLVYGFDVQFLVEGHELDVNGIRKRITAMGEYPLVEGDGKLVKVHVHVPDPGAVLTYAVGLGFVTDVVVENMDDMSIPEMPEGYDPVPPRFQEAECAGAVPAAPDRSGRPCRRQRKASKGRGWWRWRPAQGWPKSSKAWGRRAVVSGGQTMNPSTQELLQAIQGLPNAGRHHSAEQQQYRDDGAAGAGAGDSIRHRGMVKQWRWCRARRSRRASARCWPSITCLDLAHNVQTMSAALGHVQTGEVTTAVHDAQFNGIKVHAGDIIGLLNDELTATGPDSAAWCTRCSSRWMRRIWRSSRCIMANRSPPEAESLRAELRELYPDQEIEIVDGGQPFYHYIISAE